MAPTSMLVLNTSLQVTQWVKSTCTIEYAVKYPVNVSPKSNGKIKQIEAMPCTEGQIHRQINV